MFWNESENVFFGRSQNIGERRGARSLRYIDEKRLDEGSGHSGKYGV